VKSVDLTPQPLINIIGPKVVRKTSDENVGLQDLTPASGLHEPHLDIIGPDGGKKRIIDHSILENDQALNVAIQDFKNNWNVYIERWNKWHEEKK